MRNYILMPIDYEEPYWNERAKQFGFNAPSHSGAGDVHWNEQVLDAWVGQHDRLLDFGCGTGMMYSTLYKHCKQYVGVDPSSEMAFLFLENQKLREGDDLKLIGADGKIPFPDESFDAVVTNAVLQHIIDPSKFMRAVNEIKRVLKIGGTLYIHEVVSRGVVINQPSPWQRIRPIKLYGVAFHPEITLLDLDKTLYSMHICKGVKKELEPVGDKIILDIGCGSNRKDGAIGMDVRRVTHYNARSVDIQSSGQNIPFADRTVDEIWCENLLEHFDNPYPIIMETHRVIKKDGKVSFVVPYAGSRSANGDPSHRFLMDGETWLQILQGFFGHVAIYSLGHFFSGTDSWKKWQLRLVEKGLYGMAQGGRFVCSQPLEHPQINYIPWWLEEWVGKNFGADLV